MFDRTRDWADVEAMLAAGSLDLDALRETLSDLIASDDPRLARVADAAERAAEA